MTFEKQLVHLSCIADIHAIITIVKLRFRPSANQYYKLRPSANYCDKLRLSTKIKEGFSSANHLYRDNPATVSKDSVISYISRIDWCRRFWGFLLTGHYTKILGIQRRFSTTIFFRKTQTSRPDSCRRLWGYLLTGLYTKILGIQRRFIPTISFRKTQNLLRFQQRRTQSNFHWCNSGLTRDIDRLFSSSVGS